ALFSALGEDGFPLFDRWSSKSPKYNAATCRDKWRECRKLTAYSVATIIHYANEYNPDWRAQIIIDDAPPLAPGEEGKPQAAPKTEQPKPTPQQPKPTVVVRGATKPPTLADLTHNMRDLRTMTFDPLQFIVPNYIPEGLTALGGRPKIGKSWL